MTHFQYQQIKKFAEIKTDLKEHRARKYAEVKAYMFLMRDVAEKYSATIEEQQTYFWSQEKYKFFTYVKNYRSYTERADEIIHQFAD